MSYTTTRPSVPHIWAFKRGDPDWRLAQASGWTRADLMWERLMEAGNAAFCAGDMALRGAAFPCGGCSGAGRFRHGRSAPGHGPLRAGAPCVSAGAAGRGS